MVDAHIEQSPVLILNDPAQLLFDEPPGRQTRTRIGKAFALRAPDRTLNPKLELLDVERFGDVVIRPQLQPLQTVAALVLLREKDDRDMAGTHAGAESAADLVS